MSATKEIKGGVTEITLTANVYREDDQYIAQCVELPAVGQGDTTEDAVNDLKDAAELYLEAMPHALDNPRQRADDLIVGVRNLEQAYSEYIAEPVEPVNISLVDTITFSLITDHAWTLPHHLH